MKTSERCMDGKGVFSICSYLYENLARFVFLLFLSVAGQLQNLLFKELIASRVGLRAESCLITY